MNLNSNSVLKHNKTEFTNFSDSFFFNLKILNDSDELFRVYDYNFLKNLKISENDVLISELVVFFKYMSDIGMQIILIKGEPNNKIILNSLDLENFDNVFYQEVSFESLNPNLNFQNFNQPVNTKLTPNWVDIKNLQSSDLFMFFEKYFFQSLLVISHISNNCYYYDMVVAFKPEFNLNQLEVLKFNSINLKKYEIISNSQLTFSFFKNLLNFKELHSYKFKFENSPNWDYIYNNFLKFNNSKNSEEYKNYNDYKKFQLDNFKKNENDLENSNDYLYWDLYNLKLCKEAEKFYKNYSYFLKNCFWHCGWNLYTINFEWDDMYSVQDTSKFTYPINDTFYFVDSSSLMTYTKNTPNFNLNFYEQNINKLDFESCCNLDFLWLFDSPFYSIRFHNILINVIKYNTNYKTFLNKKNIKK